MSLPQATSTTGPANQGSKLTVRACPRLEQRPPAPLSLSLSAADHLFIQQTSTEQSPGIWWVVVDRHTHMGPYTRQTIAVSCGCWAWRKEILLGSIESLVKLTGKEGQHLRWYNLSPGLEVDNFRVHLGGSGGAGGCKCGRCDWRLRWARPIGPRLFSRSRTSLDHFSEGSPWLQTSSHPHISPLRSWW